MQDNHIYGKKGLHGIINVGSTCYLNTAIQCMFHCKSILDFTMKSSNNSAFTTVLRDLLATIWEKSEIGVPRQFIQVSRHLFKDRMEILEQNDMEEFLHVLIERLTKDHGETIDESKIQLLERKAHGSFVRQMDKLIVDMDLSWVKAHKNEYSILVELMYGQQITQTQCLTCKAINHNHEVFTTFPLAFPSVPADSTVLSIESLLQFNMKAELVCGWKCDICRSDATCRKSIKFWRLPRILMIVLKRFNSGLEKTKTAVKIDPTLTLDDYTIFDDKCDYNLVSLGCHVGNIHSGHYYAICKHFNGSWYRFDDSNVEEIGSYNDINMNWADVYVAFYEKI